MQEKKTTHFLPSPLPDGPWIIFSSQAGDESFGMGGSLMLASQQKIPVILVILSNDSDSQGKNLDNSSNIRHKEAAKMAEQANIFKLLFYNQPDHLLSASLQLIEKISALIITEKAQSVFIPALTEFHPAHRATAQLVWQALKEHQFKGHCFSYEISSQQPGCNYLIDISNVIEKKKQLLEIYKNQLTENNHIETTLALNKSRTYTLTADINFAEAFYHFNSKNNSLTENIIQQFRSTWNQEENQKFPLISIIVRTKDRLSSLKTALNSIAKQSYNKIEVLIVNDGGCDISEVTDDFSKLFHSIIIHNFKTNQGRSPAANQGLKMSTGEFITFLDDDDTIYSNHIESLVAAINDTHYKVVYNNIETNNGIEFQHEFDKQLLQTGNFLPIHSVLFSREFIDQGICFDTSLNLYEDWDFWLQISELTPFYHLNVLGGFYNNTGDSDIGFGRKPSEVNKQQLKIYDKLFKNIGSQGISDIFKSLKSNISTYNTELTSRLEAFHQQQEAIEQLRKNMVESQAQRHNANLQIEQLSHERAEIIKLLKNQQSTIEQLRGDNVNQQHNANLQIEQLRGDNVNQQHNANLQIEQLSHERAEIIKLLKNQQSTIEQLREENVNANIQIEASMLSLAQIKNTLSWKITKPLRKLRQLYQPKGYS